MTILHDPIERAIDAVSDKYQKKAQAETCALILQKREIYIKFLALSFTSGCVTNFIDKLREDNKNNPKGLEAIDKIVADQDSPEFTRIHDYCENRSTDWTTQGKLQERIISDLGEHFNCMDLWRKQIENETSK